MQEEGHWIRDPKPDYAKAWNYYREAFQLGGRIEDAISMARLYVKEEYRPEDISWEIIEGFLEDGAKVPIIEALELMIETLKKNGKEKEILKYLRIGADSGSLSMKHEYGIRLLSTDNGTALQLIEEAGERKYQPSVEWLINYYGTYPTYSPKNYEKWMSIGADMGVKVCLDDYIPYLVKNNPEKAKYYLFDKYPSNKIEYLLWIYKYQYALNIEKEWLLSEFKTNFVNSDSKLSKICEPYADFLLKNNYLSEYKDFYKNISSINLDEGRYFHLLKEVYEAKELNKDLANRIKKFTDADSINNNLRLRGRMLLQKHLLNKNNSKILVVDDVVSNALLLKSLLKNDGYNVCTANSGKTCIDAAYNEKPNIILLDITLPDLNGFDVALKLKKDSATKNIPIIFLGNSITPADLVHGVNVGASDFISKPFSKEELFCRIEHQIILSNLTSYFVNLKQTNRIEIKAEDIYSPKRSDFKIMIVDNVWSNIALLKIFLTSEKFQVITANNGCECIELAQKECPDLISLDVMMPDISGFDVAKALKQDSKTWDIPIMFLTALNSPQDRKSGLQLGASDFLTKPFDRDELVMRILNILTTDKNISLFLNS